MSGSALRNFRFFEQLCRDEAIENSAIVTNMWNLVDHQLAEAREEELRTHPDFFEGAIDAGSQYIRHMHNTTESAREVLNKLIQNQVTPLGSQKEPWGDMNVERATGRGGLGKRQQTVDSDVSVMNEQKPLGLLEVSHPLVGGADSELLAKSIHALIAIQQFGGNR